MNARINGEGKTKNIYLLIYFVKILLSHKLHCILDYNFHLIFKSE